MLRFYLDLNILTKLKKYSESKEAYKILKNNLEQIKKDSIILYSSAHISDLLHGKNRNIQLINEDLQEIKEWTKGYCLNKYWNQNFVTHEVLDPFISYENSARDFSSTDDIMTKVTEIFKEFDFEANGLSNPLDGFKQIPHNINLAEWDKPENEKYSWLVNNFKNARKDSSFYALVLDVMQMMSDLQTDDKKTQELRKIIRENVKLENINNEYNIFHFLNSNVPKSFLNKTFSDFKDQFLNKAETNSFERYNRFLAAYNSIDFLGYHSDSKQNFASTVTDANHAFYAAYCDVFISNDKKLRAKAKALYKEYNISTLVFSPEEFNMQWKISDTENFIDLLIQITKCISIAVEKRKYTFSADKNIIEVECTPKILNFFNRIVVLTKEEEISCILAKTNTNYADLFFYTELAYVINKLHNLLGDDIDGRKPVDLQVEKNLSNYAWILRYWIVENIEIEILLAEGTGMVLIITFSTEYESKTLSPASPSYAPPEK